MKRLWGWSKEKPTAEEINKKLLLVTDITGRTVWHVAAEWGIIEI